MSAFTFVHGEIGDRAAQVANELRQEPGPVFSLERDFLVVDDEEQWRLSKARGNPRPRVRPHGR